MRTGSRAATGVLPSFIRALVRLNHTAEALSASPSAKVIPLLRVNVYCVPAVLPL